MEQKSKSRTHKKINQITTCHLYSKPKEAMGKWSIFHKT